MSLRKQQLLQEIQQKLAAKEEKSRRAEYMPPPLYDAVFWEGLKYLDDLAYLLDDKDDKDSKHVRESK